MSVALYHSAIGIDKIVKVEASAVDKVEDVPPVLPEFAVVQIQYFDHGLGCRIIDQFGRDIAGQ